MISRTRLFLAAALIATAAPAAAQPVITVNPATTAVHASVSSFILPVTGGSFRDVKGRIALDFARPERSRIALVVNARTLASGKPQYDGWLKGPAAFHVEQFPTLRYEATGMTPIDAGRVRIDGRLTMRGVTRPLSMLASVARDETGKRILFTARGQVNRLEYGIDRGYPLVTSTVDFVVSTNPPAE